MAWAVFIAEKQQLGQERQTMRHREVGPQLLDSPEPMPGLVPKCHLGQDHTSGWLVPMGPDGSCLNAWVGTESPSTFGQTPAS